VLLQLCLLGGVQVAVSKGEIDNDSIVQTFDEMLMISAKPASAEQQAWVDQIFAEMASELKKEKTTVLKSKKMKSKTIKTINSPLI
jgi:ribosomal protein L21